MSAKRIQVRIRRDGYRYSYGYALTTDEADRIRELHEARMDDEERSGHIIGSLGEVLKTGFRNKAGVVFEIVGTESRGKNIFDCVDYLKNKETGKIKEVTRRELFNATRNRDGKRKI